MYAYEVIYEVLIENVVKRETIGITHNDIRTSEDYENYIRTLLHPFKEIKIIKAKEISIEECELKFGK